MHGNAGNKNEGLTFAPYLMPHGIDLLTFDFSGCGNSEGQWVTLGFKEKDDLHAVLQHLKEEGRTSKVLLWGRSMGAATTLMYAKEPPLPIAGLVLDSCFSEFKGVAQHMVSKMGMPVEFFSMMWPSIVQDVNEKTGMNLNKHNPILSCPNR